MHREFEVITEDKLKQYEIVITNKANENNYQMEIIGNTKEDTYLFKRRLGALKTTYECTGPMIPNYKVTFDETNIKTIVEGNVANAIELLMRYELLSRASYDAIYSDEQTKQFLEKSKAFELPKKKIADTVLFASYRNNKQQQEITLDKINRITRLKNELVDEYKDLSSENLNNELDDFLSLLNQKRERPVKFSGSDIVESPKLKN